MGWPDAYIQVTGMTVDRRTIRPMTRLRQSPFFMSFGARLVSPASESPRLMIRLAAASP